MFLRLYIPEDKPFNDLQTYFGLTDLDMDEIRHTPKRLNFFLSFVSQYREEFEVFTVAERRKI